MEDKIRDYFDRPTNCLCQNNFQNTGEESRTAEDEGSRRCPSSCHCPAAILTVMAAQSTRWSYRGFRFCSQQPHASSQPSHNCISRGSNALAWPLGARASGMNRVYIKLTQSKESYFINKGKSLATLTDYSPEKFTQNSDSGRDHWKKRGWEQEKEMREMEKTQPSKKTRLLNTWSPPESTESHLKWQMWAGRKLTPRMAGELFWGGALEEGAGCLEK